MLTDEDVEYYSGRNRAAVAMSNAATETCSRMVHLELARHYADLADSPIEAVIAVSNRTIGRGEARDDGDAPNIQSPAGSRGKDAGR